MSLLMPELERQLRQAVRDQSAGTARPRRRARLGGIGGTWIALAASAAVVLAVVGVILAGHGTRPGRAGAPPHQATAGHATGTVLGSVCARSLGRANGVTPGLRSVASGTVDGHRWALRTSGGRLGVTAFQHAQFVLDGAPYNLCYDGIPIQLIDTSPHGVAFGVFHGHGTFQFQLPAGSPSPIIRLLHDFTMIVQGLPRSACDYSSLMIEESTSTSNSAATGGDTIGYGGPCRPGAARSAGSVSSVQLGPGNANAIAVAPPVGLSPAQRARFLAGRTVAAQAGCLACHTIGNQGNNGPGPPLGDIGDKLKAAAIRSTVINPSAPMPSFRALPRKTLRALVAFLSELRGQ